MASSTVDFIRRYKRPLTGTLVGVLVAVVALTAPRLVFASFQDNLLGILSGITYWLISMLANLLVVVINIMVAAAQYSKFLGVEAVEKGWAITRDVCNMFFIVVLLIIAFGTILRIENYRYNRLLARLIVMAILVNFSKFIAGFFIDFGQVVMLTFVNAWRDVAAGNFTSALGLSDIIALSSNQQSLNNINVNSGAVFTALVLGLAVVLIAVIVMVIIAIVLIIRILALWFLVVLSPLAYLLRTYPSTEKYAARWWQEFGRYVVTGPVVAFLLWLSLAIMSGPVNLSRDILATRSTTGETTSVIQGDTSGSEPAQRISATISAIGQSDKLLSYMIGIMLLVGTLVITKELGVAGGQMAGQWASKIQGFATKAATLAGAGIATGGVLAPAAMMAGKRGVEFAKTAIKTPAKGVAGGVRNWLEGSRFSPLRGINMNPKEWMEGIREVGKEHRKEAIDRRNAFASRRLQGGIKKVVDKKTGEVKTVQTRARPFLGAMGSPELFWKYKSQLFKGREFDAKSRLAFDEREKLTAAEKRVALRKQGKELTRFGAERFADKAIKDRTEELARRIAAARTANPNGPENRELKGRDKDGNPILGRKFDDVRREREKALGRTLKPEELDEMNKAWNTGRAQEQMAFEERMRRRDERISKVRGEIGDPTKRKTSEYNYLNGESYDEALKKKLEAVPLLSERGFDEELARRAAKRAKKEKANEGTPEFERITSEEEKKLETEKTKKEDEIRKKHEEDWVRQQAEATLASEREYTEPFEGLRQREVAEAEKKTPAELEAEGRKGIDEELGKVEADIRNAESGKLTSTQRDAKEKERDSLAKDIEGLRDALSPAKIVSLTPETIEEMRRKLADKTKDHGVVMAELRGGVGNEKDREAAKKELEELRAQREKLSAQKAGPAGEAELRTLEEALVAQRGVVQKAEQEVARIRPPVPFEMQRDFRDSINEKKKQILSDSWHEHAAVFEDALRRNDAGLAAAALVRATEYGNENELMNQFGYDYTPEEFKNFIEDMFVDKLHLSEAQALSVATDVGYIAEKTRHWNIARTTHVDSGTGRLKWQKFDDQQKEVEAEVGKLDFEDFMRRGNRLAWGGEYIGGAAMAGASRQEKAEYFRSGGGREFKMAPYSMAILADNFGKMMRNMGQARYNVNLSMKLNSPMNQAMLEKIAEYVAGTTQLGADGKRATFQEWRNLNSEFSAAAVEKEGQFRMLERILTDLASR